MLVASEADFEGTAMPFKKLLQQISGAFPEEQKLHNALSLTITKVSDVAGFKEEIAENLGEIYKAASTALPHSALNLLNFLHQQSKDRIAFFPKPSVEGLFDVREAAVEIKRVMLKSDSANHLRCEISIPSSSHHYLIQLGHSYSQAIAEYFKGPGSEELTKYFLMLVDNHSGTIDELRSYITTKWQSFNSLSRIHDGVQFIHRYKSELGRG